MHGTCSSDLSLESAYREGLLDFFVREVLTVASQVQTSAACAGSIVPDPELQTSTNKQVLNDFGKKLIECISEKPKEQVHV